MQKKNNLIRMSYGIVVVILCMSYIVIRAQYSAITLDEAHTYIDYVTQFRFGNIIGFFQDYDGRANNHLLNTVLMWLTDRITGIHYDEFIVRFPNVCFGAAYCVFVFSLYQKNEISVFIFSLLMLNETLMGSFALGRGYGMASALATFALYLVRRYVESDYQEYKFLTFSIVFFTLAEMANTVVLLLTVSAAMVLFVIMLQKKLFLPYLKHSYVALTVLTVCNCLLLWYHIYVSMDGEGKQLASFHGSPIDGIIGCFVRMYTELAVGVLLLILFFITALFYGILKKKCLFFVYLFFIYFGLCSIAALLFGKGMPSGLALLPACPLLIFAIGEIVEMLWDGIIKRWIPKRNVFLWRLFTVCIACLLSRHFVRTVKFDLNNDLEAKIYDSIMGSYEKELGIDDEELHELHMPFYQKQFLYRYGYDIYQQKYTIETMSFAETLRMLANRKWNALIEIDDRSALQKYAYELKKLRIDVKNLPETTDYILIDWDDEKGMQYIYNFKGMDNTQDTIMGTMSIFYGTEDSYGVYMNEWECLTVKPKELQPIAAICVWQDEKEEPMDYKLYVE